MTVLPYASFGDEVGIADEHRTRESAQPLVKRDVRAIEERHDFGERSIVERLRFP